MRTHLTTVPGHEAEIVCAMLRSDGIDAAHRTADVSAEGWSDWGGWREILVPTADVDRARELLAATEADR